MKRLITLTLVLASSVLLAATEPAGPGRQYIVVLSDGTNPAGVAGLHAKKYGARATQLFRHALKGYSAVLTDAAVAALEADPSVRFVALDRPLQTTAQFLGRGINRIDAEQSSTTSGDGSGSVNVNVAVFDGGIDSDHPDLNVIGGTNCTNDKGGFEDVDGHGSLVGGSIGALDNDSGFVGVAPGARLWSVRVMRKNGRGTESMIICGIDWATATRTDGDPDNDIAVANLSLGGLGRDDDNCGQTNRDAMHIAICASVAAGVVYVVSAGNENRDIERVVPAAYDEVLTATAMGDTDGQPGGLGGLDVCGDGQSDDVAATFSNFASTTADVAHTIAAPGACIESTFLDGGYGHGSGTSFSAPIVSGTVALCIASGPCAELTPAQVIEKIVADAASFNAANPSYGFQGDPIRPMPARYYGHLINAGEY